jgi:hypothetical protein
MKIKTLLIAAALSLSVVAGAEYTLSPSPFLGSLDRFKKADWHKDLYWYRNPKKKAIDYKKMIFDPVLINQSPNTKYRPLSTEEILTLGGMFRDSIVDKFKNDVTIVNDPGDGVLRVRFAIRGLAQRSYYMNDAGTHKVQPDTKLAAGTFEMEGIDSLTGERVVALVQNLGPDNLNNIQKEGVLVTVESAFSDWVDMLRNVFLERRSAATAPK